MKITRRDFLKNASVAATAYASGGSLRGQDVPETTPKLSSSDQMAIDGIAREFMERFAVPGMSVAFARDGKFLLQQGFGFADSARKERVTPQHLFRIASVSKPITSVAIFTLIEQGKLRLDDRVFGEGGTLGFDSGRTLPDAVREITVHHLLTHTCGGWENKARDPMFLSPAMSQRELIAWAIENQPLTQKPGSAYAYSNFGYCILGRIVEKLTDLLYAQAVQREVLAKCGVSTMRIGGNTLAEKAKMEVEYFPNDFNAIFGVHPSTMNVARMDAHGGWIATPSDLVKFAMHVDGFDTPPDILKPATLKIMTRPSVANEHYACGWLVNKIPNWWHNGSLPGTSAILVRAASRVCSAALVNIRGEGIDLALDRMISKMANVVPSWRA